MRTETAVLMCPPRALPALAADRVWTAQAKVLDPGRALAQWQALRDLVNTHLGEVTELPPVPWAAAMTFTRDLGVSLAAGFVPLEPPAPRGLVEPPILAGHLAKLGITTAGPPNPIPIAGGNVLADYHGRLLIGTSNACAASRQAGCALSGLTDREITFVPLGSDRFPHVDMALCDLAGRGWLAHPAALDDYDRDAPAWRSLFAGRPVIELDQSDGDRLGCNQMVGEDVLIGPPVSPRVRRAIESLGLQVVGTPLDELVKAGGGAHCLTLELTTSALPPVTPLR